MLDPTPDLTEDEQLEILKRVARNFEKNAAAAMVALRQYRAINDGEKSVAEGFAALYAVDNPGRVKTKKAA